MFNWVCKVDILISSKDSLQFFARCHKQGAYKTLETGSLQVAVAYFKWYENICIMHGSRLAAHHQQGVSL